MAGAAHFDSGARQIINAGSVGQPRDGDPRAAYGILNTDERTFTWVRVPYEVTATQEKMRAVALPDMLIDRLSEGGHCLAGLPLATTRLTLPSSPSCFWQAVLAWRSRFAHRSSSSTTA